MERLHTSLNAKLQPNVMRLEKVGIETVFYRTAHNKANCFIDFCNEKLKKVRDVADLYCKSPPQCPNWAKRVLVVVAAI